MLSFIEKVVYGPNRQLQQSDLEKIAERNPFSVFLNYNAYSREHTVYINNDQSLGLLWECSPLAFASEKTMSALEGLFRSGLPGGSVVQVILHADPHIAPLLARYKQKIVVDNPIIKNNLGICARWKGDRKGAMDLYKTSNKSN